MSGCRCRTRRSPRARTRRPAPARPGPPGLREHVVEQQHRHVAADAVALVARCRSSVSSVAARSAGAKASSCDDVRPGREVRVAAAGEHLAVDLDQGAGSRRRSSLAAAARSTRDARAPTGGRGRRGWARSRAAAARRARPARPGPRPARPDRRAGRPRRSGGCSTASRRRRRRRVGQRRARTRPQRGSCAARSPARPGCAPRRPSARPRPRREGRPRPTPRRDVAEGQRRPAPESASQTRCRPRG